MNTAEGLVRKIILTVRRRTRTRKAIEVIVTQHQTADMELATCTIHITGLCPDPLDLESERFVKDLGEKLLVASHYAEEFNKFVNRKS